MSSAEQQVVPLVDHSILLPEFPALREVNGETGWPNLPGQRELCLNNHIGHSTTL
jgi:hypothetical protein